MNNQDGPLKNIDTYVQIYDDMLVRYPVEFVRLAVAEKIIDNAKCGDWNEVLILLNKMNDWS